MWKSEFYKRKSVCEAIAIAASGLGQISGGASGGKDQKRFGNLMSLRQLNGLQCHQKKLYSWHKTLIIMINTKPAFSWLICQCLTKYNSIWRRISHTIAFIIGQLTLMKQIYSYNITLSWRYMLTKYGKTKSPLSCNYSQNKHDFASNTFFQFQNKATRLIYLENWKSKRSLSAVYCSFLTDFWPNRFLSWGSKN